MNFIERIKKSVLAMSMRRVAHIFLFGIAISLPTTFPASASDGSAGSNYDLPGMNFDLWCQEQAHLPAVRCDKRLAGDEKQFEIFRDKVDQYEIPYLQGQQREMSIHRDIMANDPVDNPVDQGSLGWGRQARMPLP